MSQKNTQSSASWYGIAGAGALVAAVAGLGGLYHVYRKNEQKKGSSRKIKRERNHQSQEKEIEGVQSQSKEKEIEGVQSQGQEVDEEGEPGLPTPSQRDQEKPSANTPAPGHIAGEAIGNTSGAKLSESSGELSKETLLSILNETSQQMTMIIQRLAMDESLAQPGVSQEVTLAKVKTIYDQRVEQMRKAVFAKYNVTEEETTQTLQKYSNDEEVSKVCIQIERINKQLNQEPLTESELASIPASLTVDRLIEMMSEMGQKMNQARQEFMEQARFQSNANSDGQSMENKFQEKMTHTQNIIFGKYEVNEDIVSLAMQKYSNDPKLQNAISGFQEDQMRQSQQAQGVMQ